MAKPPVNKTQVKKGPASANINKKLKTHQKGPTSSTPDPAAGPSTAQPDPNALDQTQQGLAPNPSVDPTQAAQDPSVQPATDPSAIDPNDPSAIQDPSAAVPYMQSSVPIEEYDLPDHTLDGFPMPRQGGELGGILQRGGTPERGTVPKPEWWVNDDKQGGGGSPWPVRLPSRKLPGRSLADISDELVQQNSYDQAGTAPPGGQMPPTPYGNTPMRAAPPPEQTPSIMDLQPKGKMPVTPSRAISKIKQQRRTKRGIGV